MALALPWGYALQMGSHTPVEVLMPRTQVWVPGLEARQHMGQAVYQYPAGLHPVAAFKTGRTQCEEQDHSCPFLCLGDAGAPAPCSCLSHHRTPILLSMR